MSKCNIGACAERAVLLRDLLRELVELILVGEMRRERPARTAIHGVFAMDQHVFALIAPAT